MLHNVVGHNPTLCIRVSSLYRATKSFVVVITAGHNGASQLDAYPKTFARSIEASEPGVDLSLHQHCKAACWVQGVYHKSQCMDS